MKIESHINTELLIDLIQGALEEEGYKTKRYSDSDKFETSTYDCIVVKGNDGNYYELMISECVEQRNPHNGEIYKPDYTYNSI